MGGTGTGGDAGAVGEGGEAGETTVLPPAKNHSAVSFVAGGTAVVATDNHKLILISNAGETQGGTTKTAKSTKYQYVPGVIAAATP